MSQQIQSLLKFSSSLCISTLYITPGDNIESLNPEFLESIKILVINIKQFLKFYNLYSFHLKFDFTYFFNNCGNNTCKLLIEKQNILFKMKEKGILVYFQHNLNPNYNNLFLSTNFKLIQSINKGALFVPYYLNAVKNNIYNFS